MTTSALASSAARAAIIRQMRVLGIVSFVALTFAQDSGSQANPGANPQAPTNAPLTLTLQDALARARKINPEYHAALTAFGVAKEDRVQSRAALLPNASYATEFIYTESNRAKQNLPIFVANNFVHEYVS